MKLDIGAKRKAQAISPRSSNYNLYNGEHTLNNFRLYPIEQDTLDQERRKENKRKVVSWHELDRQA